MIQHIAKLKTQATPTKTCDHFSKKSIWQNPASIPDKSSEESRNRRQYPNLDKGKLQQNTVATITFNIERLNALLQSGKKKDIYFHHFFSIL